MDLLQDKLTLPVFLLPANLYAYEAICPYDFPNDLIGFPNGETGSYPLK